MEHPAGEGRSGSKVCWIARKDISDPFSRFEIREVVLVAKYGVTLHVQRGSHLTSLL